MSRCSGASPRLPDRWTPTAPLSPRSGPVSALTRRCPAALEPLEYFQTVGHQPHHSVRDRDLFRLLRDVVPLLWSPWNTSRPLDTNRTTQSEIGTCFGSYATLSRCSGAPGILPDRWPSTAPLSPRSGPISASDATLSRCSVYNGSISLLYPVSILSFNKGAANGITRSP